eukprot:9017180-Pyramimonas_sp.AAC.1
MGPGEEDGGEGGLGSSVRASGLPSASGVDSLGNPSDDIEDPDAGLPEVSPATVAAAGQNPDAHGAEAEGDGPRSSHAADISDSD